MKFPSVPPLTTELQCNKCDKPLNLRNGKRGPWLGCSTFPKCRGRGKWSELDDDTKAQLEKALEVAQEVALEQEAALEMALVVAREAMALELEPHPL